MRIDSLGPVQQPDPKDEKQKISRRNDRPESLTEGPKSGSDVIEISQKPGQIRPMAYFDKAGEADNLARTAARDINTLRQQSNTGYYDAQDIKGKTSERLIASRELETVVQEYHQANFAEEIQGPKSDLRHDKIAEARTKIADGFFDNEVIYGAIADKLMTYFGF